MTMRSRRARVATAALGSLFVALAIACQPSTPAALEDTPENRAFKEKVKPAVAKYRDIGVRVEDSFLLGETGLVRLSARVPRTLEEIEAFMAGRE